MATTDPDALEVVDPGEVRVRRALLTVSDKRGLVEFARGLAELGGEIGSTGGRGSALDRRLHRLPGDPRRAREDAQPTHLRGALGRPLEPGSHVDPRAA